MGEYLLLVSVKVARTERAHQWATKFIILACTGGPQPSLELDSARQLAV